MSQEILINAGAAEIRIALVEDGRLEALRCEAADDDARDGRVGDIVLGRVVGVMPALQAAFVEVGLGRAGFLGAREARCLSSDADPAIGDLVREGEAVLVQIVKDAVGEKGARLSAEITLPGRLCVLAPLRSGIAVSRRIGDEAERARLLSLGETLAAEERGDLIPGAGYIFRTAAIGASLEEFRDDARQLAQDWRAILAARKSATPPVTLHRDLGPVERALRDMASEATARIVIDDAATAEVARAYCRRAMAQMESRIEVYAGPGALFDDLEADIDLLSQTRVPLACGGWITLEPTEALTAVDVNSGSFAQSTAREDTSLTVNLEAAREIGRQIRLRGIGGLIVADFIHMAEPRHMDLVLAALTQSLARDGAPAVVSPMSQAGLVEITRKRVRAPLHLGESCAACSGQGRLRAPGDVAMDVLRQVEAAARAAPGKPIAVRAAPEIVRWIEERGEKLRTALARKGAARVSFEAADTGSRERFDVGIVV
jgi:ribonuclease G